MVNAIRGRIYERYPNQKAFAESMGWTKQKASLIINGQREPSFTDVMKMAPALGYTIEEFVRLFLDLQVTK